MEIERPFYLNRLLRLKDNGRIKIITGMRRAGKSYLLFTLFRKNLLQKGVPEDCVISISLDELANALERNPVELDRWIRSRLKKDGRRYYIFIDEIQFVESIPNPYLPSSEITFVDVVMGLMKLPYVDIYITGSNSRMLSSEVLTQFRDRGDEVRVYPLSYEEFLSVWQGDIRFAFNAYCTYGGMPVVQSLSSHEEKSRYLNDLFRRTYIRDVVERNRIAKDEGVLEELLDILSSSTGSLTNPAKLSRAFASMEHIQISGPTISRYIDYFMDAFLLEKAQRYDVKGKRYMASPYKYYFTDVELRNARLHFRQQEPTHIMENVIFTDLRRRGLDVDVGMVEYNYRDEAGHKLRKNLEVDFVVNRGSSRWYIQSAFRMDTEEKRKQETESLHRIADSFRKMVVLRDAVIPWQDEQGILYVGVEQFLTDPSLLGE